MGLRKQKGNMYEFVTHTWNPIKGECLHDCDYCYMKRFPQSDIRLDEKELETNLGEGNYIFIGSSTDMWAVNIPKRWILEVMAVCQEYNKNTYLFQTKNPFNFLSHDYYGVFPENVILCTTIETNKKHAAMGIAPPPRERAAFMRELAKKGYRTMVTIEPIMDFDINEMVALIKMVNPEMVNVGADSGGKNLPEPSKDKVLSLIDRLKEFTRVEGKKNLERIIGK